MIKTLKESKAKLSSLVELASQGEEIVITVRGRPKARLVPIAEATSADRAASRKEWVKSLRECREKYTAIVSDSSAEILDQIREDRV